MCTLKKIIQKINNEHVIALTLDDGFDYAQYCSEWLANPETENNGRRLIINILENWHKLPEALHEIWTDIIENAGFYPYLEKEKNRNKFKNLSGELRKGLHHSNNIEGKYFHSKQKELLKLLDSDKNIIVSAPTSFGKSLLIEEIVASNRFNNIVIIQPTLALLDETRKKLQKYRSDYKLIVRTSQEFSPEKNIFLFTAERVNEYPDFPHVDFLVIDEFYKLSAKRDDERSASLNVAFHYLINKFNCKFYLLGPNIDGISEGFTEKFNAIFFKTDYSLVDCKSIDCRKKKGLFMYEDWKPILDKKKKEKKLFKLLIDQYASNEQTIIYCSSPNRARQLARGFIDYIMENRITIEPYTPEIITWIKENISHDWSFIDFLKNRVGVHDGALQKHITTSMIDYFNNNELKFLFCTTTIIEGVNTSTKNIVFFDKTKGARKPIDYFDYSNIKGRAGRMMIHYVGKIFNFNTPPKNEQIIIDIPFFEQNPISPEVLIHLKPDEIKDNNTEAYQKISKIPKNERLLIKNNGVNVFGQKSIIDQLRSDISSKHDLIYWTQYPTYEQLIYILTLAWNGLLIEGENRYPITSASALTQNINSYRNNKNINSLVLNKYKYLHSKNPQLTEQQKWDEAIRNSFQIMKHWFQYKVPKWLSVVNSLQKYVCEETGLQSGNYTFFSNQIENDFIRNNLCILSEYGIPNSAIRKLQESIPDDINQDDILDYIQTKKLYDSNVLIEYEKQKLIDNIII